MFFYKIDVTVDDAYEERLEAETIDVKKSQRNRKFLRELQRDTDRWNENLKNEVYLVSDIRNNCLVFGLVSKNAVSDPEKMNTYLKKLQIGYRDLQIREIGLHDVLDLYERASYYTSTGTDERFHQMISLPGRRTLRRIIDYLWFDEIFPVDYDDEEKNQKNHQMYPSRSLQEETDRIFSMEMRPEVVGHPVHYWIETDSFGFLRYASKSIMRALYHQGRISSRKCLAVTLQDHPDGETLETLYRISEGGCLILNMNLDMNDESPYAEADIDDVNIAIKCMMKHRNQTLTIFSLYKKDCNKLKDFISQNTPGCTFVEITQDTLTREQAKQYLRCQAEESHAKPDERLYEELAEDNRTYLPTEVQNYFDRWFGGYLKRVAYPAYANLVCANVAAKEPESDAYAKLQKMVGLGEAKQVIREALDYYKAQKLFRDRGLQESHPAMHMVFTGNPGTAKTTVARLFAQIMRDNGLLSEGKLYEVGRADLVGRYVGWTAKQVKRAFERAKGSVLFIDEAYSLVDDRSGSYGDEAISTIVQEMENNARDMVVILAGYPDEMEKLISKNPGLRSRIAYHVPFADYNEEELYGIAEFIAEDKGLRLDTGVKEKLMPIFSEALQAEDFGNGRYARNLVEKAQMRQASRLVQMDFETVSRRDVTTLTADDFAPIALGQKRTRNVIGF